MKQTSTPTRSTIWSKGKLRRQPLEPKTDAGTEPGRVLHARARCLRLTVRAHRAFLVSERPRLADVVCDTLKLGGRKQDCKYVSSLP